jgi:hypothetical protein
MKQVITDEYLATALRQAANKLEKQSQEIDRLTATTLPLDDKLCVYDFIPLIKKANSNIQIKAILDMIDDINIDDSSLMAETDWTLLSQVVVSCKK